MSDLGKLAGDKIYLREVELSDATERYLGWMNDLDVIRYMESRFTTWTMDSIRDYIRMRRDNEHFLAICAIEGGVHIGNIKLGPISPQHRCADVSLFIGEKGYWGKGLGTEAIELVVELAFGRLGLNRLQAGACSMNMGSVRAFERAGFGREGLLKQRTRYDGEPDDVVLLGYIAADYARRLRT